MNPAETEQRGAEETEIHTRMLRIGLAEADSRVYWRQAPRDIPRDLLVRTAFEERWFGSRTEARVRYLVNNLTYRFDAFPGALQALARWNPTDLNDRKLVCHWHVQLSDPLYREFTSQLLGFRRQRPEPTIDRTTAVRWVEEKTESRWSSSTSQRMATGLLACAAEVGLCDATRNIRALHFPKVSDQALGYLLYLLRGVEYEGSLNENPYLDSVGVDGELWSQRVRQLPWISYRRMADVHDLKWQYSDVEEWGREAFAG